MQFSVWNVKIKTRKSQCAACEQHHIFPLCKYANAEGFSKLILHVSIRLITCRCNISKSKRFWEEAAGVPVHRGVPASSQRQVYNHVYGNQIRHRVITGSHGAQNALPSLHPNTENTRSFKEDVTGARSTICLCLAVRSMEAFRRLMKFRLIKKKGRLFSLLRSRSDMRRWIVPSVPFFGC